MLYLDRYLSSPLRSTTTAMPSTDTASFRVTSPAGTDPSSSVVFYICGPGNPIVWNMARAKLAHALSGAGGSFYEMGGEDTSLSVATIKERWQAIDRAYPHSDITVILEAHGGHLDDPETGAREHVIQGLPPNVGEPWERWTPKTADLWRVFKERTVPEARTGAVIISCYSGCQDEEAAKALSLATMSLTARDAQVRGDDGDKLVDLMTQEISAGNMSILHPEVLFDACLRRVSSCQAVPTLFSEKFPGPTHWGDVMRNHMGYELSEANRAQVHRYFDSELGEDRVDRVLGLMQGPSDPEDLESEIPIILKFATSLATPDYRPSRLRSA